MDYKSFIKNIEKQYSYKIKVKGGAIGKPNSFNNSLVIYKKGLVNYFIEGKDFLTTIKENQELIDYQIIKKRTAQTKYLDMDSEQLLPDKVLRLFPVTKGGLRLLTDKLSKIPEVPERCILVKENIKDKTINDIDDLDINYYINGFNDLLDSWIKGSNYKENIITKGDENDD